MQEEEVTVDCECGDKEAVKRTRITRMPKVLLIQLMRFNGATGAKLDHPIGGDFHITVEGAEYELVGALVHTGSSFESGHYYTVTRDIDSKEAYICNDDYPVQQLEGAGLQGALAKAYMLVYQREERRPREEQIPEENKQIHEEEKSGEEEKLGDKIPEEEKRVEEEKLGDKIPEEVKRVEEVEQRKAEQVSTQPRPNAETMETVSSGKRSAREVFEEQVCKKFALMDIPTATRTEEEKKELKRVNRFLDGEKHKFPEVSLKKPSTMKSGAERKAKERSKKTPKEQEKEREAARKGMEKLRADKTPEEQEKERAANRKHIEELRAGKTPEEQEQERAATRKRVEKLRAAMAPKEKAQQREKDRQSKATKKYGMKLRQDDGFRTGEVLSGEFGVPPSDLGEMDVECKHCGALMFKMETTWTKTCCLGGKVEMEMFPKPPDALLRLLYQDTPQGRLFRQHARMFNNGLCLSSVKMTERRFRGYTPSIVIEGRVHQFMGSLQAKPGERPLFSQLYVHDPGMETTTRLENMHVPVRLSEEERGLVRTTVEELQALLKEVNPFVRDFRQIVELADEEVTEGKLVISAKARPAGEHARRYNLQTNLEEVSVLTNSLPHDLVVTRRDGKVETVSDLNPSAMPLHFTLLFPHGTRGWDQFATHRDGKKRLSTREFYAYHMAKRHEGLAYEEATTSEHVDYLHRSGRLYQEWVVMGWVQTESQRLVYQEREQKKLRVDQYKNFRGAYDKQRLDHVGDALYPEDNNPRVGMKILARSFIGSPRWYHMQYLDAMAICREYTKPDWFITATCNPQWKEIQAELAPGQRPEDRPDLTARVFKAKMDMLLDDLTKGHALGKVAAYAAMVEFQKRGLPHVHILTILAPGESLDTAEKVDAAISAELPPDPSLAEDEDTRRELQALEDIVKNNMIHGPCGALNPKAPCMEDGKCTKGFPKEFRKYTTVDPANGFPTYRRRRPDDGGRTMVLRRGGVEFAVDNRYVVPHNIVLSKRYGCHINTEKSTSPRNAKYLYKYISKGPDRAMTSVEVEGGQRGRDEIADYKDLR